ncbi:hypothetical protein B4U79_15764 [Dinothrombium tinctorium]|uniref:SUN domain-containing protein n=1 Tax=Dinothrombium tinctorium TaxID=1965070 RepID=A0A3S3PW06_9ACAR|nr:hypothetical protein B4U79_15764 [Dinothrombium tinctorium]
MSKHRCFLVALLSIALLNAASVLCDEREQQDRNESEHKQDAFDSIATSTANAATDEIPVTTAASVDSSSNANVINPSKIDEASPIEHRQPVPSASNDQHSDEHSTNDEQPVDKETMPSFDEWKKKMLAEADNNEILAAKGAFSKTASSQSSPSSTVKGTKSRIRNYASHECGAKVVAANSESDGTSKVLNEQSDEYMLNPCKAKIWFVIELCEVVQPISIELANFELFSSTPKDFNVYGSERFPTREWSLLGSFTASDMRNLQNFELQQQNEFRKYIKVEILSYHGSEHYCPLSVFHVYGFSMVEQFDAIEREADDRKGDQLDEDLDSDYATSDESMKIEKPASNLLGSAREAVFNIVRKAALALSNRESATSTISASVEPPVKENSNFLYIILPHIESKLKQCDGCFYHEQIKNYSSLYENNTYCRYLKAVFGELQFSVLCKESQKETELRFKCPVLSLKNTTCDENVKSDSDHMKMETKTSNITDETTHDSISPDNLINETLKKEVNLTTLDQISEANVTNLNIDEKLMNETKQETPNVANIPDALPDLNTAELQQPTISTISINETIDSVDFYKNTTVPSPTQVPTNGMGSTPLSGSQSKESIFIRMNNRIKALEVNLTLTNQYLEELSLRYRRQMDDMQNNFNKTITKLKETARLAEEKDLRQQEKLIQLQIKLNEMDEKVSLLITEKETLHWQFIQVHIVLLSVEIIIMITISSLFVRRISSKVNEVIESTKSMHSHSRYTQTAIKRSIGDESNDRENHSPAKTKKLEGLYQL